MRVHSCVLMYNSKGPINYFLRHISHVKYLIAKQNQDKRESLPGLSVLLLKRSLQTGEEMSTELRRGGDVRWLSTTQAESVSPCWLVTEPGSCIQYQHRSAYRSCHGRCPTITAAAFFYLACGLTLFELLPKRLTESREQFCWTLRIVEMNLRGGRREDGFWRSAVRDEDAARCQGDNWQTRWRASPLTAAYSHLSFGSRLWFRLRAACLAGHR